MKFLLINPRTDLKKTMGRWSYFISPLLPLGIAYIASVLEKSGHLVQVIDQYADNMTNKNLLDFIYRSNPDAIGFSCLSNSIPAARILCEEIKKIRPAIKIILGNIHPTVLPENTLKTVPADIIVRGEGELTILELLEYLENKKDLTEVKGITYRNNGTILHNPDRPMIKDLDDLPYPAWHHFNLKKYNTLPLLGFKDIYLPIQSMRGCSHRCYFCAQDRVFHGVRIRKVKKIVDEIEYFHGKLGIKFFRFNDPYFPINPQYGFEFCDELISRGLNKRIKWVIESRVDVLNDQLCSRMKEAGLSLIAFGFESGSENILNKINKRITLNDSQVIMNSAREAKLNTFGCFILGLPGENQSSCRQTIDFALKLDCDLAKFSIATPYPGSRFFEDYQDTLINRSSSDGFSAWHDSSLQGGPVFIPQGMSADELIGLQKEAMRKFYLRPRKILKLVTKRLLSWRSILWGGLVLISNYFHRRK